MRKVLLCKQYQLFVISRVGGHDREVAAEAPSGVPPAKWMVASRPWAAIIAGLPRG